MPIKGQYEQCCNAAALERLGIKTFTELDENFYQKFNRWINSYRPIGIRYTMNSAEIVERTMEICGSRLQVSVEDRMDIDELMKAGV